MSAQQMPRKKFLENLRGRVLGNEGAVTLVIGEIARWSSEGKSIPAVQDLSYIEFAELDHIVIAELEPEVVLSPLVTDAFDAFQIVKYLESYNFTGRYRAIAPHLPNLAMVKQEIANAAPSIDFDIVIMPPTLVSVGS